MRSFAEQVRYASSLREQIGLWDTLRYRVAQVVHWKTIKLQIAGAGIRVRSRTSDLSVAWSNLNGEFDPLTSYLDPDFRGLIIDAGGNIGTSALALARLFPKATVAVVEPSVANFRVLLENVKDEPRIRPIRKALGPVAGDTITLVDRGTGSWGFSTVRTENAIFSNDPIEDVETTTITEIAERFGDLRIGLVKLDIEGAEKALFEEAPDQFRDVPLIFAELHDFFLPGCEVAFRSLGTDRRIESFGGEKYLSISSSAAELIAATGRH